jgi:hypothetical protein
MCRLLQAAWGVHRCSVVLFGVCMHASCMHACLLGCAAARRHAWIQMLACMGTRHLPETAMASSGWTEGKGSGLKLANVTGTRPTTYTHLCAAEPPKRLHEAVGPAMVTRCHFFTATQPEVTFMGRSVSLMLLQMPPAGIAWLQAAGTAVHCPISTPALCGGLCWLGWSILGRPDPMQGPLGQSAAYAMVKHCRACACTNQGHHSSLGLHACRWDEAWSSLHCEWHRRCTGVLGRHCRCACRSNACLPALHWANALL